MPNYGCGLSITRTRGRKRIEHNGGIQGFNADLVYWPEEQITVVVLANLNGEAPDAIAGDLGTTVHGDKVVLLAERKEVHLTPEELKPLAGRYSLNPDRNVDITLDGNQLKSQITGQPKLPIFPESPTTFYLKVVNAEMNFEKNALGQVDRLTIHQGGRDTIAKKISDTVPAGLQYEEINISPDKLNDYVGTYDLAPGFALTITVEGDHLQAQATNQPKVPVFPEAPDKFFYKVVEAQLDFSRNDTGEVTQLTLHQGG